MPITTATTRQRARWDGGDLLHPTDLTAPGTRVIDPAAVIHATARIGSGAAIGALAVVGEDSELGADSTLHSGVVVGRDCRIGAGVVLHPLVVLYDGCVLGDRVVVHAGAVIGADGFGYRFRDGRHVKVPQLGWVEIEADVEVGAGTTIDRGSFGPTHIRTGTKAGNLVMVAHNCEVGRHNVLAAQVGIAGSSTTGDHTRVGPQGGIADHVRVGDRVAVAAQSAVLRDVPADARVRGCPARPEAAADEVDAAVDLLTQVLQDVGRIERRLGLGGGPGDSAAPPGRSPAAVN